jgi:hypothetical protein
MHIVFGNSMSDKALLEASLKALDDPILAARYGYTVEYDDNTEKTTLWFWRLPGGTDAK